MLGQSKRAFIAFGLEKHAVCYLFIKIEYVLSSKVSWFSHYLAKVRRSPIDYSHAGILGRGIFFWVKSRSLRNEPDPRKTPRVRTKTRAEYSQATTFFFWAVPSLFCSLLFHFRLMHSVSTDKSVENQCVTFTILETLFLAVQGHYSQCVQ